MLDEKGKRFLGHIVTAAGRMNLLIDDLLTLSRITAGALEFESVDLSAIVEEVAGEIQCAEPHRHVTWKIDSRVTVQGNPGMLRAAITNLVGNAWKYSAKRDDARIEFGRAESARGTDLLRRRQRRRLRCR